MKLTIERLGRIQRAELDIRPLTVLIGPNNTNKTWTAYALYECLQSRSRERRSLEEPAAPPRIELSLDARTSSPVGTVRLFPAERSDLLLTWSLIPELERLELPLPIKDFGRFLAAAQTMAPAESMAAVRHPLSCLLQRVMGGEIAYEAGSEIKRLVFRTESVEVPIHAAASLVRAVAGLALYVDRFLHPEDVLIIDELEMNAHPQAQLALTEFIAVLVNAGVSVVLTTHSPYVVDHLNNLMEAFRVPEGRRAALARRFSLETPSCFISSDKVSVQAFQEQSPGGAVVVQDVLNRETNLIDWSTFSRVSEHTTNLYSDILRTLEDEP